jgi:Na+/H+ antiporter NhaD/arsenite permease-like protein
MDLSIFQIVSLSLPFVFVLLSVAAMPLLAPSFWHKFEILILSAVAVVSVISTTLIIDTSTIMLKQVLLEDYIPFIIMLFTLYTLSHGIYVKINSTPTTISNIIFLFVGSIISSLIGTTGASMLLLRSFLDMNKARKRKAHLVIFFIFLISNAGGLLSPLGDPPLLLGYLHGVKFFWCIQNLFGAWLFFVVSCLIVLAVVDHTITKKEPVQKDNKRFSFEISGMPNVVLVVLTVFVLFIDGNFFFRNLMLISFCILSITKFQKQKIDFAPFREVAVTFAVIFIVIAPVLFILNGYQGEICKHLHGTQSYFWMCGTLSSFLDNAPSYLLLFDMCGGTANQVALKAISIGAVVMGSVTYIGNAPNMMVRSIAVKNQIKMPSFIGYIGWSFAIVLPLSFVLSLFCF